QRPRAAGGRCRPRPPLTAELMEERLQAARTAAPVADEGRLWVDRESWRRIATAVDADQFYDAWLELQCLDIGGVRAGLVLAETQAADTFAPVAAWPRGATFSDALLDVARSSLDEGEALVVDLELEYGSRRRVASDAVVLSFPLKIHDRVACV